MKKFLLFSAFLALCGHLTAADNLLQDIADEKVTQLKQYVTVDVSELTPTVPKDFVLSFTLNQVGINFLNTWRDRSTAEEKAAATPMFVTMKLGDNYYGVGMSGQTTLSKGSLAVTNSKKISDSVGFRAKNVAQIGTKDPDPNKSVLYYMLPDKQDVPTDVVRGSGEMSAVAVTLSGDSEALNLTVTVKYDKYIEGWEWNDDTKARDVKDPSDRKEYANGSHTLVFTTEISGGIADAAWSELSLNSTYVDFETLSLSAGFEDGETAQTRNASLLYADIPTVPEPATATLSLLALASLAARRRRK